MKDEVQTQFGQWPTAAAWFLVIAAFLLFVPFHRKVDRKPAGAFTAFALAFAFEMYGVPFSLYLMMGFFGRRLPEGVLGETGHYIFLACLLLGGGLVVAGWARIYREYWSKDDREGRLVREGLYRFIRHPQYAGLLLISLGMLFEWATIPLLFLWPILIRQYYRLARREESELAERFAETWTEYRRRTGMFMPKFRFPGPLSS
ncbi:MAG: isoprenylcysteine carboxylmethyltransferase family protein [Spirochaetaceae bacterium]|nr:isoprenylcysteine carboxylmethyltransferase family protein [Spirochaetaceae bacterium]